ncbi:hypothetical protein CIE86_07495 [Salmonella enterica subsp. enterica serovar Panama]|nr:hypothetical protein [Salmonella enterica subsp. enterica]EDK3115689.1 hypothetical protein [Salmonella enterica subsp. enterica serovar Panama]EEJ0025784.1 hypothetical protein [Salmonella enterica subsp. enterica]EEQ0724334.1 hypothetical protein [Salmonella enterica]
MKKQNHSTLTNYLAKTNKNADLYRLYNPQHSVFSKTANEEQDFYFCYFSRHMITQRNILTLFSIHTFLSYNISKKETIKSFVHFLRNVNRDTFNNAFQFRGCNIIYQNKKREVKEISWFSFSRVYDDIVKIKEYEINNNTYNKLVA